MKVERIAHELVQHSPEWHQFRLDHDGASEAAAMLGLSKNVTRSELLRAKHTGIAKEFSDFVQERILDHGHVVEALARPMAEELIADELYPATYSFGRLSASCDGLTMDGSTAFEHKQWASELAASVARGELPEEHQPQCQQILLVTGAEQVLFMVSDGTPQKCVHISVRPNAKWFERIVAGWAMFHQDLDNYQLTEETPSAAATPVIALPAVSIQVKGEIALISNLPMFGAQLAAFIDGIDKNPSDDQAFANAEAAIKALQTAQEALEFAESGALAQTASIDEMHRTVALYIEQARSTRLMLEKLVKARKDTIRIEIMQGGKNALAEHVATLTKRLGKPYMPTIQADFAGVIRGKKTIASLRDAVDTELARAKIEANEIADRIGINLKTLAEQSEGYAFLFADIAQICLKANDDFTALVKLRISEHKAVEQKRQDELRERIRQEEAAKLAVKAPQAAVTAPPAQAARAANPSTESAEARAMLADFVNRYGHLKEFATVVSLIKAMQRRAA